MEKNELIGAEYVFSVLGNPSELSRKIKRSRVQLQKWKMDTEKGGLGNRVPQAAIPLLEKAAFDEGKRLDLRRVYGINK